MIIFALILILALGFGVAVLFGAPYLPIFNRDVEKLLDMLGPGEGKTLVDLGCGDGRVLLAAAKRGYSAVGYEINPMMWAIARVRTWRQKDKISVKFSNYWSTDLGGYEVVFTFLIDHFMQKLEAKLVHELKPGAVLISYVFELPSKKPWRKTKNASLYRF